MTERTSYAHGTPSWIDLSSRDVAASREFYGPLFGWTFEENPTGDPDQPYVMASRNGKDAAGMMKQPAEQQDMGIPPMWATYISVDDIEATMAKVEGAGGKIMAPAFDVMESGRMSVVVDPTGAVFCLWQPKEHIGAQVVNEHGSLIWNELITPDVDAAADFYAAVLGWTRQDMEMPGAGTYTTFSVGDDMVCGAMAPPMEGIPPHWAVYFGVDDAEATVAAAGAAGAQVINPPMAVPTVGTLAHLTDPGGAMFAIMQPEAG